MRIPEGTTSVHDAIRGEVIFQNKVVDDQVLLKSDGFPTYHLANIVDDHLMGITHVIRGEEWLPSAVKHVLLYRMFGWEAPVFAHLPLLMREDGSKLSKRFRDSSLDFYIEQGYLPEAILNFVALLGWHPTDAQLRAINGIDTIETAASDAPASSSPSSAPSTASTSAPIDIDADAALLRAALAPTESKKKKAVKKASPAAAAAEKSSSALLGESLSEVFTIEDMTGIFDISRVQKGGAAVEMNKLNFYQSQYWRKALEADPTRLAAYVTPKVMSLLDRLATGALTEDDITALGGVQYASISADVRQQDPCHGVGTAAHAAALKTTLSGAGSDFVAHPAVLRALKTTRDHPCKVSEFPHLAMFAWARPQLDSAHADTLKEKVWVSVEAAAVTASSSKPRKPSSAVLEAAAAHIEAEFPSSMFDSHDVAGIVSSFKQLVKAQGVGLRDLYLPMRFALSGSTEGPGVADQMCALGKEETLARIKLCLEQCK
jgi:glutamyl/glutaminyl-tRNA synthetase